MNNSHFTTKEFNEKYGKEMVSASSVYAQMTKNGFKANQLLKFDFDFTSDKKEKLDSLSTFLTKNYAFSLQSPKKENGHWILVGDAIELPYNEENLIFWVLDLYCKGYKFDCKLTGYGAMNHHKRLDVKNETDATLFKKGIDALNNENFGAAIIYFTISLELNPKNPETWQARGYCKDEIYAWKAARKDYDKALEIDPNFVDALLIRATNKDEAREYKEALIDYDKVIELDKENDLAYFNRGNTKFNLGDKKGACEDWHKAKSLGSPNAQERIDLECK